MQRNNYSCMCSGGRGTGAVDETSHEDFGNARAGSGEAAHKHQGAFFQKATSEDEAGCILQ